MLRVTADVFSGRPDPSWIIADEAEARATLRELTKERSLLTEAAPATAGLGFRGLRVEALTDELANDFGLDAPAFLPGGAGAPGRVRELTERLIGLIGKAEAAAPEGEAEALQLDTALQDFLAAQAERTSRVTATDGVAAEAQAEAGEALPVEASCPIELGAFNPGFWNNDPNIRARNNCYNYAANKRTDSFAQPGRGCGNIYKAITCAEVTRASLCDGLKRRFNCFPDSEKPRYLVALVVAPGPGFVDFHWYRRHKEGFWGHKPGGTAARNTDNSNRVIHNPETCNRGPYTQFCGYFYTCRSQRIR
jgi:hypothetical protein